jgi:uncharacterized protein
LLDNNRRLSLLPRHHLKAYHAVYHKNFLFNAQEFVDDGVPGGAYRIDEKTGKITRYKSHLKAYHAVYH